MFTKELELEEVRIFLVFCLWHTCPWSYTVSWPHDWFFPPAWYIPPSWISPSDPVPTTILEAAQLAKKLADNPSRKIPFSNIPLIIHQTWGNTNVTTWSANLLEGVEKWLKYATSPHEAGMAYFVWLDDGCESLIRHAEPGLLEKYNLVPLPVERSDIFRIVVVNTMGGIVSNPPVYKEVPILIQTVRGYWYTTAPLAIFVARGDRSCSLGRPRHRRQLQHNLHPHPTHRRYRSRQLTRHRHVLEDRLYPPSPINTVGISICAPSSNPRSIHFHIHGPRRTTHSGKWGVDDHAELSKSTEDGRSHMLNRSRGSYCCYQRLFARNSGATMACAYGNGGWREK